MSVDLPMIFRGIIQSLKLQDVKNDQNGTNFQGTSLKISLQLFITEQEREKSW